MSRRTKTLIAAVLIVFVWLPAYAVFIAGLQWRVLPGAPWYVALLFYALAGTLWIVPIGLSLPWMYREPQKPKSITRKKAVSSGKKTA
jgi:energy-coupling factor transporter transmembrane protein EcfT